jgi:L-asparagine transporter-like permease
MINIEKRFFLKKALLFCLVLIGISLLLYDSLLKSYYLRIFPVQFSVIALVTVISHLRLMNAIQLNVRRFNTIFLSIMSIKLIIYLGFILVCLLIDRSSAINFVLTFLILYLFFTIFEVTEISNFLKKNTNSSN